LPTPKRDGWYTAKSGGTKVSATTKMAAKNVTVYAQWKKKVNANTDSKMVGHWKNTYSYSEYGYVYTSYTYYNFYYDGTFKSWASRVGRYLTGKYTSTGGKVHFNVMSGYVLTLGSAMREDDRLDVYNNSIFEYECSADTDGKYLQIAHLGYHGGEQVLSKGSKFRETSETELDDLMKTFFGN